MSGTVVSGVRALAARLKQVLYNYLSNALKFTPSGGTVTVRASSEGSDLFRLEVHDTGSGIQPADLPRLFVEFQQLDAGSAKKHAGTGLGLALTKRIVEAQGGSVGVRSTPGVGSVFHAVLPRQAKVEAAPATAPRIVKVNEGAPAVLIVEDNAADQRRIVAALNGAGYAVELAATGAHALARFRERTFAALTLDLILPDMSGVDLLARIRAESSNADVPVIVLTVVAEQGAVAGFTVSDVLAKPIDSAALLQSLGRAGVLPQRRGAVLVVDDDPGSLKLMEATLGRSGYQTICRQDGEAALQAAAESHRRRPRPHHAAPRRSRVPRALPRDGGGPSHAGHHLDRERPVGGRSRPAARDGARSGGEGRRRRRRVAPGAERFSAAAAVCEVRRRRR